MSYYIYQCKLNTRSYCIVDDKDNIAIVPKDSCHEWEEYKTVELGEGQDVPLYGVDAQDVISAVDDHGYWAGAIDININDQDMGG